MYLVFLLVLTLAAFSQQHCRHHHHNHNRMQNLAEYHSRIFEEIANDVIELDKKSQRLCEAHANSATKETFERNRYVLKIALQDFGEEDIKVEVRHRVVYINAFNAKSVKHYTEVKELPAFVDAREAKWDFEDGVLQVVFPTKNTLNYSCNPNIVDDVINIPKFQLITVDTVPRFGQ